MKFRPLGIVFAGLLGLSVFALPQGAFAHGVGAKVSPQNPIAVEFYYSTGEKMSYTPTMVYSPDDAKIAYQEGNTDDEGRFAFVPTKNGEWTVICDGPDGHRATWKVNVELDKINGSGSGGAPAAALQTSGSTFPQGKELAINTLLGISLLFNLTALWFFLKGRKK